MEEIAVRIVVFSDRNTYQLQWADPLSGKKKTKSSKVARPRSDAGVREHEKALKAAAIEASDLAKQLAVRAHQSKRIKL